MKANARDEDLRERRELERFVGTSEFSNQGHRVVEGRRQPRGLEDLTPRDLYLRQLWDSKISADVSAMRPSDLALYARLCGWTLARYLGSSDVFDRAIAAFTETYADQNECDHATLVDAIATGRVQGRRGSLSSVAVPIIHSA